MRRSRATCGIGSVWRCELAAGERRPVSGSANASATFRWSRQRCSRAEHTSCACTSRRLAIRWRVTPRTVGPGRCPDCSASFYTLACCACVHRLISASTFFGVPCHRTSLTCWSGCGGAERANVNCASPHSDRSVADRRPAYRDRLSCAVRLGIRAPRRWPVHPTHRRYRSDAVSGDERAADLRWLALAGHRMGRRPGQRRPLWSIPSDRASRGLPAVRETVGRVRPRLLLLVLARAPGGGAHCSAAAQATAWLRPLLLGQDARAARRGAWFQRAACGAPVRAR